MDIWLERLDRLLNIIRPKTHNIVARAIIALGIVLVAESQLNIIQAIFIATYERYFGYSDILREYMEVSSNSWIGLFLIVAGLIYHYLITVGKEQVELRLSERPQKPELNLDLLNADFEQYEDNTLNLRGFIAEVPSKDEISEYKISCKLPNMEGFTSVLNTVGNMEGNPRFYHERGEFLKVWGGSELISLRLTNPTEVLATGVRVEITFPRIKGVSADNTKEELSSLPRKTATNRFSSLSASPLHHQTVRYDIKTDHNEREYCFFWNVNDIQANTSCTSDTYIFLRSEESFDIEITIYCDQFPTPVQDTYRVNRKEQSVTISIADLMAEDDKFIDLVNSCVMDGYMRRAAERKLSEYEHESQELVPRG